MFQRFSNGFALAGSTWRVLIRDKHLLIFPIISGILFAIVVASFFVPSGGTGGLESIQQATRSE